MRPDSITIKLLADGEVVTTTTASEANGWAYSFEDLDVYENGVEIEYTIEEETVAEYDTTYDGYDVTNTHTPGTVEVSVTKVWDDADDQDGKRPTSVTINLLADGEIVDYISLTEEGDWTYTFTNLDKYADGKEIEYTITENYVEYYTAAISGDAASGYTVTNSYDPETVNIDVTKYFDVSDKDTDSPSAVTVVLYANGVSTGKTIKLSEDNNWYGTFKNLPKYEDGVEIEYTIKEKTTSGDISVVTGDATEGFTITTYTNESTSSSGTTSSSTETDDEIADETEDTTSKTTEITTSGSEDGSVSATSVDGETENSSFKWYIPVAGVGVVAILGVAIFLKKRKEEEEVTE